MSINKAFVVKNGFEASTNLIVADADTRRVGVGTTVALHTLHVNGGIGVTDFYVTGIGTFANELNVGLGGTVLTVLGIGNSIGIGTTLPQYLLDIRSQVSTGQTALYVQGDVRITGDLNIDDINLDDATIQDLNVTGITTVGFITATNLYVAGVGTFLSSGLKIRNVANTFQYSITGGAITANRTLNIPVITGTDTLATLGLTQTFTGTTNTFSGTLSINRLYVTGISTFVGFSTFNDSVVVEDNLRVGGISTFVGFSTFNDSVVVEDNLRVGGISTFKNDVEFSGPSGITSVYWDNSENALKFLDNAYAFFGFDDDLKIYHDGSNSWIRDSGFGDLLIAGSLIKITNSNNTSSSIIADPAGKVELYYNNNKKIETVSTGATVYGTLQSQQLQVNSGGYFNGSVGIGTTNPGAKLNVVDNSSSDALRITQTGSGNALVVEDSTNPDSTPVVISATGRIGIGTINPTNARYSSAYTQLVVSGDSSSLRNGITIDAYTTPGIVFQGRFFEAESSTRGYLFYYPFNSNTYSLDDSQQITGRGFVISPSERNVVAITSSFLATSSNINVGIGTTNPTEKLDVNGNVKLTGSIYGPSELIIDPAAVGDNTGSVRIKGNLYVDGTQTILNSTTIELGEFNVGIATTVGTNALLDGAGIGIGSTGIRKTLTYANTPSDSLKSSENFDLASGKVYKIDGTSVLSSTTLGSSIVNSSLTSVGTLTNLIVTGVTTSGGYNATTGNEYKINGTSVLTSTTLGSNVVNSSLTSVGTLGQLNVSGVSTLGVTTATNVTLQQLNVSGVSTLGVTTATNLTLQQLNVSGVSTLGITTATNVTLQQLNVSGVSTLGVTTATNVTLQQLNVSGVSTFAGITTVTGTTLFSKQLNVSGVSTLGGNVSVAGSIFPSTDATYDLGSLSLRWRNVYTTDLQLSNEGSQNEVDNTWGKWTIQEGEENLFIINRRTGKKYKFLLEEVN
jgi:cytoskeletal protein CcmA (bactofilin family)